MSQKKARAARKAQQDQAKPTLHAKVILHLLDEELTPMENINNILHWLENHEGWQSRTDQYDYQIVDILNTPKIMNRVDSIIGFDAEGWWEYAMEEAQKHPLPYMTIGQSAQYLVQRARTETLNDWIGAPITMFG